MTVRHIFEISEDDHPSLVQCFHFHKTGFPVFILIYCNISCQKLQNFLANFLAFPLFILAFRSFPTISFTVTIHSLQKYDLNLKISANSVFIIESWDFRRFWIFVIFFTIFSFNRCPFELSLRAISEQFPNRTERFPKLIWRSKSNCELWKLYDR
jgi:hypothetical protein